MRKVVAALISMIAFPVAAQDGKQPPWPPANDVAARIDWQIENVDLAARDIVVMNVDAVVAMDRGTLSRQGDLGRAWFSRDVLNQSEADKLGGRSALIFYETDCATKRSRFIATTVYSGTARTGIDESDNTPGIWAYNRPDSQGEAMAAAICDGRFYFSADELERWADGPAVERQSTGSQ